MRGKGFSLSRRFLPDAGFCLALIFFGIIRYWDIFGAGKACLARADDDLLNLYYPVYYFVSGCIAKGVFPLWDPHVFLGYPIGATLGFGLLYPPLTVLVSLAAFAGELTFRSLEIFLAGHLILAGVSVYLAGRMLGIPALGMFLGAVAYISFPVNEYMLQWAPIVSGIPWVPLIIASFLRMLQEGKGCIKGVDFYVYAASTAMLYASLHPSLIAYVSITLAIIAAANALNDIFNFRLGLREYFKKYAAVLTAAFFPAGFLSFLLIPVFCSLSGIARKVLPMDLSMGNISQLELWNLIFPSLGTKLGPLCCFGVIFLALVFLYCSVLSRKEKNGFLWSMPLLALFWLLYSLQGSMIFGLVREHVPLMSLMRYPSRSLILTACFLSFLLGDMFSVLSGLKGGKIMRFDLRMKLSLVFPLAVMAMLLISLSELRKFVVSRADFRGELSATMISLSAVLAVVFLNFRFMREKFKDKGLSRILIFFSLFLVFCGWLESPSLSGARLADKEIRGADLRDVSSFRRKAFPEVFNDKSLFRYHDFRHISVLPYFTGRYSSSSVTWPYMMSAHSTTCGEYYYLWSLKWPGDKNDFYNKPSIALDSPLYDLAGVKYFIFPDERIWIYLSRHGYYRGCDDEWLSAKFVAPQTVCLMRIFFNPDTAEYFEPGTCVLSLGSGYHSEFELLCRRGWQEISVPAVAADGFKITIKRRGMPAGRNGSADILLAGGVAEVEFYGENGDKISLNSLSLRGSSSAAGSSALNSADNDISTVWRPDIYERISEFMEFKGVEKIRDGLYVNSNVLPRAFVVGRYKVITDKKALWETMHSQGFDPKEEVLLERIPGVRAGISDFSGMSEAEITRYSPNAVDVYAPGASGGFLVLSDTFAAGWRVFVEGEQRPLLRAYGVFRAVYLRPGEHMVSFRYLPPCLWGGGMISVISIAVLFFLRKYLAN